jgi:hypothetical protein
MGEYEEKEKEVYRRSHEATKAFYAPDPGIGDAKREEHNRVMAEKTEAVAEALREMHAAAPPGERAGIADAIRKTENEAREFGQRAAHYARKRTES